MKLSEIKVESVMDEMAHNAWYGGKSTKNFCTKDGEKRLSFIGHTYETGYEDFSAICAVKGYEDGKEILLYDKDDECIAPYRKEVVTTGSLEKIWDYIRRHDCEIDEC